MTSYILDLDLPPEHPLRQILDVISAHPEVREAVLRVLLTEDFLALPGQVQELRGDLQDFKAETREQFRAVNERLDEQTQRLDGTNQRLDEQTQRLDGTNQRLDEQTQRLDGTNQRLDEQTQRLDETNRRLDENTQRLDGTNRRLDENIRLTRSIQGSVGALLGDSYENLCRREIAAILDGRMERAVLADRERINERLGEHRHHDLISRQDFLDGLRPDIIARAKSDTSESGQFAIVEVSITFNRSDLEIAARRAGIISNVTGVPANAFVVTHHHWPDEMDEVAAQLGVTIIRHEAPQYADV